jgi:hypothetical protein
VPPLIETWSSAYRERRERGEGEREQEEGRHGQLPATGRRVGEGRTGGDKVLGGTHLSVGDGRWGGKGSIKTFIYYMVFRPMSSPVYFPMYIQKYGSIVT